MLGKLRRHRALSAAAFVSTLCLARAAQPCTTFSYEGQGERIFAKAYDWHLSHGQLVVNKRHVQKKAFELFPGDSGVAWTSEYGSVTFNQYGREFPNAGINEAGLVVEVMVLASSQYPNNATTSYNESQFVQYQLDRHASVAEVLADLNASRVSLVRVPLHYLVCDTSGACATIEGIAGNWVVHTGATLPVQTLTNDTYASSVSTLAGYKGFGGKANIPTSGLDSLTRFVRAADHVAKYDGVGDPVSWAFAGLAKVSGSSTQWRIVYEQTSRKFHFATQGVAAIRSVDTTAFDYTCGSTVKTLDLAAPLSGDVTNDFVAYDATVNAANITKSLQGQLPPSVLAAVAAYPNTTSCAP